MKQLLIVVVTALAVCQKSGSSGGEDCFTKFCREASETDGVEFVHVDGVLLGMARAFMDREGKALMKSLKVNSMDMLLVEKCEAQVRLAVMEQARALLDGDSYIKVPAGGGGNSFYLERGEGADTFTALVVLFDGDGRPGLYRLCGDIRPAELEKIIL
ncbi:MAG: DUF4252 domain-containing protein [Bacteroidales bacterium]|nr:DUF4252 domain-containing protein [Candidatus Cacconaster caballi]